LPINLASNFLTHHLVGSVLVERSGGTNSGTTGQGEKMVMVARRRMIWIGSFRLFSMEKALIHLEDVSAKYSKGTVQYSTFWKITAFQGAVRT
jgi:hypothetical protein